MTEPDLGDLAAFAAVARARGFRGAAAVGGASASALSEAVRRLEGRLGVRLLNRTTRSVTPTEAGRRLLERLAPALHEIGAAVEAVNELRDSPVGTLRLNVPVIVARTILPPLLGPFLRAHPGIALEVTAEDDFIDVLGAGYDAGIRYEERLERDMIAIPIGPRIQRYATAATPAFLERHGRPQQPRDLLRQACIRHRFASGRVAMWEFQQDGRPVRIAPDGPLLGGGLDLELGAALQHLGLIHSFEHFLQPLLRSGELEEVLADWSVSFSGPFLYYASRRHLPAPLRAFVDFLKARPG